MECRGYIKPGNHSPEGNILLRDVAAVHGAPGRPLDGTARDVVLLINIDASLTAAHC